MEASYIGWGVQKKTIDLQNFQSDASIQQTGLEGSYIAGGNKNTHNINRSNVSNWQTTRHA